MNTNPAFSIVSAVVTPAILILACSSLITTTAHRLSMLLDRVRELTHETESPSSSQISEKKKVFVASQLLKATRRTQFLQRTLATLYLALGSLILTSVCIGIGAASAINMGFIVIPVIASVSCLFYASTLLIRESRIAISAVNDEMAYARQLSDLTLPKIN